MLGGPECNFTIVIEQSRQELVIYTVADIPVGGDLVFEDKNGNQLAKTGFCRSAEFVEKRKVKNWQHMHFTFHN